jgi:hypothetical protein
MAKATITIKQVINYQPDHAAWFAANQVLFNHVAAFYFQVIQAHAGVLDLPAKEALTALERLTHTTHQNPHPVMPLEDIRADIPAMFRRAAIHAALASARSFYSHLARWRKRKEKAEAKGKKFHERPPVPPRTWNKSATLYLCQACGMQGNADRNASLVIGQRLVARSQKSAQGKPPTPLATERSVKAEGVAICQEAKSEEGPSMLQARHADGNEHGTAHDV